MAAVWTGYSSEGFLVQGFYPCIRSVWLVGLYALAQVVMLEASSPVAPSLGSDQGTSPCCRPGLDGNLVSHQVLGARNGVSCKADIFFQVRLKVCIV